jgi:hypothetical protein
MTRTCCAVDCEGRLKATTERSWARAIRGKVERSRLRRPKESIVQRAGIAKRKLIMPKPREMRRAAREL